MAQQFSDSRLVKSAGGENRSDRNTADAERVEKDGTALSAEERRALLRDQSVQTILPAPPEIPGFHVCWLTTTSSTDPIYKRMQLGYLPVTLSEIPGYPMIDVVKEGTHKGCISCNEMLLFKIEDERYQDLMAIYHFDMPREQEQGIYESVMGGSTEDSNGKRLDLVEGDFKTLGKASATPPRF